jgi:transcriptional antiterminator RfaH
MMEQTAQFDRSDASDYSALKSDDVVDAPWYLAYTKPRQEHVAQVNLLQQAFETYLPRFKTLSKKASSADMSAHDIFEPMFARYIFFRPTSPRQSIATARSTRGLSSIVSFGHEMATISPETIATIRACEQERNTADISAINPFQTGDKVRMRADGMQSLRGLVHSVSAKRVKLLLEILGQQKLVIVNHFQVELT